MPFVVKTQAVDMEAVRDGRVSIYEPIQKGSFFGNGFVEDYDHFIWFWAEQGEGNMLVAHAQAGPISVERDENGKRYAYFTPRLINENVVSPISLGDFRELDREACETPMEKLNKVLYVHSLCKATPIDQETYEFLLQRFN